MIIEDSSILVKKMIVKGIKSLLNKNFGSNKKVKIIEPANENNTLNDENRQTRVSNRNKTIMQQHKQIPHHHLNQNK